MGGKPIYEDRVMFKIPEIFVNENLVKPKLSDFCEDMC